MGGEGSVRPLLVDVDTGADDALAIVMALHDPGVRVLALTTVAGNVDLDQATANALSTLDACGRLDIPVHRGADRPLVGEVAPAVVHGYDGLGNQWLAPVGAPAGADAVDATLDLLRRHGGALTWVALGPLTNVARAVAADREACASVGSLVVMGGAPDGVGNVTPTAEYNTWADAEAARVVLGAGLPVHLVGWDVTRRDARVGEEEMARLRAADTPLARFALAVTRILWERCLDAYGAMPMADPVAMAAVLRPDLATWERRAVSVDTGDGPLRGTLLMGGGGGGEIDVCTGFDADAFRELFLRPLLARPPLASPR